MDGIIRASPLGSVGKESACNAGDPGLIPGLGISAGEGIGYPFRYLGAVLVAQLVKNPSAVRETLVERGYHFIHFIKSTALEDRILNPVLAMKA